MVLSFSTDVPGYSKREKRRKNIFRPAVTRLAKIATSPHIRKTKRKKIMPSFRSDAVLFSGPSGGPTGKCTQPGIAMPRIARNDGLQPTYLPARRIKKVYTFSRFGVHLFAIWCTPYFKKVYTLLVCMARYVFSQRAKRYEDSGVGTSGWPLAPYPY